jgi:hypothetical protein
MNAILQTFFRIFGGAILCFFAFVPAWVGIHLAPSLIDPAERQIVWLLVALAVCIALTYFLGLLAYRAFTGRGRKSDGGLLPPWAMMAFVFTFGIFALAIVGFGLYNGDMRAIRGGVGYLVSAIAAFGIVRWRQIKGRG